MPYYKDLPAYLKALDELGMLTTIKRPVKKETQLASLARLQYRGLPEEERKGFVFENVESVKGQKYNLKVAAGIIASSRRMYMAGLQCRTMEEVTRKWAEAQSKPLEPRIVSSGPVQEEVHAGSELEKGGLDALPIPVDLPGFSGGIRTTYSVFVTKDIETGIRNAGNYSAHIFGKKEIAWEIIPTNHGYIHWRKCKDRGKELEAAIVVGGTPNLFYVAATSVPYGLDEFAVAGGLAGEPMDMVKCKTVDVEVPANAEIVIEGRIGTEYMQPGNAYGEYLGYMAIPWKRRPEFEVTCITHRKGAFFVHLISQMPPSESSVTRVLGLENVLLKFLKIDCNNPAVLDVVVTEMSQNKYIVIRMKKTHPSQAWQALNGVAAYHPYVGKIVIAVDEDIDPRDHEAVIWALSTRMQPHRDIRVSRGKHPEVDLSAFRPDESLDYKQYPDDMGASILMIDATLKWPFSPIALPRKEFMVEALNIWKEEGLAKLNLKEPWYGYELGYWPEEFRSDADHVVKGDHYLVGERLKKQRVKV